MSKKPDYIAYTVKQRNEGQKSVWTAIGSVWNHRQGGGFDLVLNAMPLDGRIVCVPPRDDEAEKKA